MSPVMAARWAIVCAFLTGGGLARADKRPVAVINLSDETATRELATLIETELTVHPDLRGLPSTDAAALKDGLADEDRLGLEQARALLQRAEDELNDNPAGAERDALEGQRQLWRVSPARAMRTYADLTLVLGQALLARRSEKDAAAAFALVRRLDPTRKLDGMIYLPEVVAAFDSANRVVAPTGEIEVKGAGRVSIDGAELGEAPGKFLAAVGSHVVWLTGPERETRAISVAVISGLDAIAEIPDAEATSRIKLQRARLALARAPDASARASAMKRVANLVGVHDAVLLSMAGGKVIVQTWRDREPGFSALRERRSDKPADLLSALAPTRAVAVDPRARVVPPRVTEHWYQKTSWRFGIAATVAAAIVGGVVWASRGRDSQPWDTDIAVLGGTSSR